ncbi:MAG: hypothetical protein KAU03_06630 [Candidatus Altiarchaeales archaeon]|nr:hypothetical protein [Candidatus Altiarchaeales archaeon]
MDKPDTMKRVHKTNIERLLDEFGGHRLEEINKVYNAQRSSDESNARIQDFMPIFTYRAVRENLILRD